MLLLYFQCILISIIVYNSLYNKIYLIEDCLSYQKVHHHLGRGVVVVVVERNSRKIYIDETIDSSSWYILELELELELDFFVFPFD